LNLPQKQAAAADDLGFQLEHVPWRTRRSALLRLRLCRSVLALLHLTSFMEGQGEFAFTRAWKGHDWAALDRLHQKGLILSKSLMAS